MILDCRRKREVGQKGGRGDGREEEKKYKELALIYPYSSQLVKLLAIFRITSILSTFATDVLQVCITNQPASIFQPTIHEMSFTRNLGSLPF